MAHPIQPMTLPAAREQAFSALARSRGLQAPRQRFLDRSLRRIAALGSAVSLRENIAARAGLLQRVDPRVRLGGTLLFLASVSCAGSLRALMAHAALAALALALSRIRVKEVLGAGLWLGLAFSAVMALPATLNLVNGGRVLLALFTREAPWQIGPFVLPPVVGVSREGLLTGATFLLRAGASLAAALCLTLSSRWTDLLRAVRSLGVPPICVQTAGMAIRYLFVLLQHAEAGQLARKTRVIARSPLRADQMWVGSRLAASWERSLGLMEAVGDAMTARGFRGELRFTAATPLRGKDWIFLLTVGLLCLGLHSL
jgi:cobalt/nickel transport system permease protein